jgi:hypothetical protein
MFGRYAVPTDELAQNATSITASAEDDEYEAANAISHVSRRPAKLTTFQGTWAIQFSAPVTIGVAAFIHTNWDQDLDVTLIPDGGTPIAITVPDNWENGWIPSPWKSFSPQTSDLWTLSINEDNSVLPQVLKILLYAELRDLEHDVRWGVVETEEQGDIYHVTEGGTENIAEVWGPQRSFAGEFGLTDQESSQLIQLHRYAKNRITPWLLIPDVDVNDAWWVRFAETTWQRNRENPDHNIFPFRAREVARGLPWP